jgi:hypothetical protein
MVILSGILAQVALQLTCQKTLSDIEFPYYHAFSMFVWLEIATVLLWVVAVSAVHLEIETPLMRRLKASPMFWLHIPKCGTSFANTVMHMPNMCPGLGENLSFWMNLHEIVFFCIWFQVSNLFLLITSACSLL